MRMDAKLLYTIVYRKSLSSTGIFAPVEFVRSGGTILDWYCCTHTAKSVIAFVS